MAVLVVDQDSHPCADNLPAADPRRPDLKLPGGGKHRAPVVRVVGGFVHQHAVFHPVIRGGLAGDGGVAGMLGGNLGTQLMQAVVLALCLGAFGESAYFSQLVLINTAVSLFSGIMHVPGGMGVTEAGLTWGLQAVGVPAPVAVSTAITYRLVTFYLPPIWGAVAMRWLRRREYV